MYAVLKKLNLQRMIFWLGESERGEGVYYQYITEAKRAFNNAKNSVAKSILGVSLLLCCSLSHASEILLAPKLSMDFSFAPNTPQVFSNILFWSVTAKCQIVTEDPSNDLYVRVLSKYGQVNGLPLHEGDQIIITVHSNDTLNLQAGSGAKIEITNLGDHIVTGTFKT